MNSTVSGHRQFHVTFRKKTMFFPNDRVVRYFDYPVLFPNLLKFMLAVKTGFTEVARFTKRWTALLPGKVKLPENCLHATAKTPI